MPRFHFCSKTGVGVITLVVVDLFCGAGGLSEAAKDAIAEIQALNPRCRIDTIHYAVNCWDVAIRSHKLNHPGAIQLCQRVEVVKPAAVVKEGWIDLLCAGVECIYHSHARGDKPIDDQRRSSAWSVPDWLQVPTNTIVLECVREIKDWGPLDPITKKRDKKRKGAIYQAWVESIRAQGFVLDAQVRCCADYGDPTTRTRWFLYGRSDGLRYQYPETTHASPKQIAKLKEEMERRETLFPQGPLPKPWRTARNAVIDWDLKGTNIFDRKKPLVPNTLARIEAGLRKFGGPNALPWIIAMRHYMGQLPDIGPLPLFEVNGEKMSVEPVVVELRNHCTASSADEPLSTVCASGNHFWVAEPCVLPHPRPSEGDRTVSVDTPLPTVTASSSDMFLSEPILINDRTLQLAAIERACVAGSIESDVIKRAHDAGLIDLRDDGDGGYVIRFPWGTEMQASRRQGGGIADPFVVKYFGTGDSSSVGEPLPTATTKDRFAVASPVVCPIDNKGGSKAAADVDVPVGTITTKARFAVAEPFSAVYYGPKTPGDRVKGLDEPVPTLTTENRVAVVQPCIVNMKGNSDASDINAPLPTQTTAYHCYIAEPHILFNETFQNKGIDSVDAPTRTIRANARHNQFVQPVAEPFLTPHQKFGEVEADSVDAPVRTITANNAGDNGIVEPFLVPNFGEREGQESRTHSVEEPLPCVTSHGAGALVQLEAFLIDVNHGVKEGDSQDRRAQSIDDPIGTITAARRGKALVIPVLLATEPAGVQKWGYQLVTEHGTVWIGILLRMLKKHELARATSLEGYEFAGSDTDVVRQIGNAVPKRTGKAFCFEALAPIVEDILAREMPAGEVVSA